MNRNYVARDATLEQDASTPHPVGVGQTALEFPGGDTVVRLNGRADAATVIAAPANSRLKRAFDLTAGILLVIAFAPLMAILAFVVSRDGGPVLFGHRRIGAGGRPFTCWKFRSMVVDAEGALARTLAANPEARREWQRDFKLKNDPRVTPLGRFLRKSSLDELPQLFSVVTGEMSLIGPRPIVADEIVRYGAGFAEYSACRPGITGLWQVSGRNDVDYAERVAIDCRYTRSWSFWTDMTILYRTIGVVLSRSGAY